MSSNGYKAFDANTVREDFPIMKEVIHGKPLTFLDSAASAQKPQVVIDKVMDLYSHSYANIHRGIYKLSQDATEAYEQVREKVAKFLNAPSSKECLFVSNATEGINLVAQSYGRANISEGDEIILTELEHHSNIVPWQLLCEEKGASLKIAPINDEGEVDLVAFKALLSEKTKLVAMAHISNAIGTILPVKEMIALAHKAGAVVLVDGCQAAPHTGIDVQDLDADFYVFSGHKVYGPTGVGVLYGKQELLDAMPPWQGGGDMIELVTFEKTTFNVLPQKFEAGTPNIAGVIGLGAALDYLDQFDRQDIARHEHALLTYANDCLRKINQLKLVGTAKDKASIISFVLDGIHPHDAGTILDQEGVAVRTGHHCAQPLMARLGISATVRASFGMYNTKADVDRLVEGLKKTREIFA